MDPGDCSLEASQAQSNRKQRKIQCDMKWPVMSLALSSSCGVYSRGPNPNRTTSLSSPPLHRWKAQGFLGMTSAPLASSALWEQAFHFHALLGSTRLLMA